MGNRCPDVTKKPEVTFGGKRGHSFTLIGKKSLTEQLKNSFLHFQVKHSADCS
jgi:hypothetical protein